ncbi:hypothetical protein Angca_001297, partial [Angiostrongylus cantonensis]
SNSGAKVWLIFYESCDIVDVLSIALHPAGVLKQYDPMYNSNPFDVKRGCQIKSVDQGVAKIFHSHDADLQQQQSVPVQLSPSERIRSHLNIRPGFDYYAIELHSVEGIKFGLCIKHYRNQVIICKVDTGSIAAKSLRVLDRIIKVNGLPVTHKDVCKTLISNSITVENRGIFVFSVSNLLLVVENPASLRIQSALTASLQQPPSVTMPSDVKSIVRRQSMKI